MKAPLLSWLLVATALHVNSSSAAEKANFKQPHNSTKILISYATKPFDLTADKLQEFYVGHNIVDIYNKLILPQAKGEFEKTDEYDERISRWKKSIILGTIASTDTLAFQISQSKAPDSLSVTYDADREELKATISFENHYFNHHKTRWLETAYLTKNLGSNIGITRLGIKFKFASHIGSSLGIGVKEQIAPISISNAYSRDDALRTKHLITAYAIGNLEYPYKIDENTSSTASLDDPNEWLTNYFGLHISLKAIWLVNSKTGEVIAKLEAPFAQCRNGFC